ncbi:MAG: GFA family protein [Proteobacteria bacterium]|nr:GFA family protein [Pseudomonadota bacterium]
MPGNTIEGGCLCGAVRYAIGAPPQTSLICHCRTCRRASAAPSVAWITVDRAQFAFTAGTPASFSSSPPVTRTFCAQCGSPLTYITDKYPESIDVTTVSLDEPERYAPTREVWLEYKLAWEPTDPHLRHS